MTSFSRGATETGQNGQRWLQTCRSRARRRAGGCAGIRTRRPRSGIARRAGAPGPRRGRPGPAPRRSASAPRWASPPFGRVAPDKGLYSECPRSWTYGTPPATVRKCRARGLPPAGMRRYARDSVIPVGSWVYGAHSRRCWASRWAPPDARGPPRQPPSPGQRQVVERRHEVDVAGEAEHGLLVEHPRDHGKPGVETLAAESLDRSRAPALPAGSRRRPGAPRAAAPRPPRPRTAPAGRSPTGSTPRKSATVAVSADHRERRPGGHRAGAAPPDHAVVAVRAGRGNAS